MDYRDEPADAIVKCRQPCAERSIGDKTLQGIDVLLIVARTIDWGFCDESCVGCAWIVEKTPEHIQS